MRQAFVTGATGFLGLNIVEQLTAAGTQVHALYRKTSRISDLQRFPVTLAEGSLDDRASLERAIPEGCDAVFHVAANLSLWSGNNAQQTKDNVDGTRNVVEAALARGVKRLVLTSSQASFGPQPVGLRFDETAKSTASTSWINYERTKYLAEIEVEKGIARGLPAVILNPGHIVGRYDRRSWARMILLVDRGELPGVPPGGGSFADGTEVAKAHVRAAEVGRVGERYLLGGTDATFLELITDIGKLLGKQVPNKPMPLWALKALGRVSHWGALFTKKEPTITPEIAEAVGRAVYITSDKAIRELGYRAVPLKTMVRGCWEWMKGEGLLAAQG